MWIKQKRYVDKSTEQPLVTIRNNGIGLNKKCLEDASAKYGYYVELFVSPDKHKLGFRFSKDQPEDSYLLGKDGGRRKGTKATTGSAVLACGKFIRDNLSLFTPDSSKPYVLTPSSDDSGIWFINLALSFPLKLSEVTPDACSTGVYRYLSQGEVVYVGHGLLKERFSSKERTDWVFDEIEYRLVDSEDERFKLERMHLDSFLNDTGRLPLYNRYNGRQRS